MTRPERKEGSPSFGAGSLDPHSARSVRLTLGSYNIHAGIGHDGRCDRDRILRVILELNADILALQEAHGLDLLDFLARHTGFKSIASPTLLRKDRHYGNALLTRLPICRVQRLNLSVSRWESRNALDAVLSVDDQPFRVLITHFGLQPTERRRQTRQLLHHLKQSDTGEVTALLGDFNEWLPWGRPLRWLNTWFGTVPAPTTYPARFPLLKLDRIWLRPRQRLLTIRTHKSRLARLASDHLPVIATVDFSHDAR